MPRDVHVDHASERKAGEPKKLPGIFISYRRSDNPDAVGRIYDRLVAEFGKARVFKDVDSIPLGQDFRGHLNDIVGGCVAVLAIIGPKWIDTRNSAGQRRLDDSDDFVRIELEAALSRDIPVVPVLVGHATMPGTTDLPASLESMVYRQSIEVRPDPDFHNDATRLVSALWAIIDPNAPRTAPSPHGPRRSWLPWLASLAAAMTLAVIALAVPALRYLRQTPPPETRIAIPLPVADGLFAFALSPDGRQIVYVAKGDVEQRLWLRSLATTTAQPLPGTAGAFAPFWSPDGRSIAFFARGALKRLEVGGSQPQTLAAVGHEASGAWGAGGDILFNGPTVALMRVAATGGPVTEVTRLDASITGHRVFAFLPDGTRFLFATIAEDEEQRGTYLGTLDGSPPVRLTGDVGPAAYLPSGWMLLLRVESSPNPSTFTGTLLARRLDVRNARLTGQPVTIAGGARTLSASATGFVAYRLPRQVAGQWQLTWMDRSGAVLGTIGEAEAMLASPRIAPDGRRVAASRTIGGNEDIWLLDGVRAGRMTFDAATEAFPAWSPDGTRIAFPSNRSGGYGIYQKPASGAGADEQILTTDGDSFPLGWSSDGHYLLYAAGTAGTRGDIWVLPMTGDRKPFAFLNTQFNESRGQFSPDGRWVAYQSDESGNNEVYVRPFAASNAVAGQWQVSTAGGVDPVWRADGREIYYISPTGDMMAAPIEVTGSAAMPGTPVKLFAAGIVGGGLGTSGVGRQYDVARDGRFLINREVEADEAPAITLIHNWNPEAKQ